MPESAQRLSGSLTNEELAAWLTALRGERDEREVAIAIGQEVRAVKRWEAKAPDGWTRFLDLLVYYEVIPAETLARARERAPLEAVRGEGRRSRTPARTRPGQSESPRPKRRGAGKDDADRDVLP